MITIQTTDINSIDAEARDFTHSIRQAQLLRRVIESLHDRADALEALHAMERACPYDVAGAVLGLTGGPRA